jgi:hypothetical protein
MPSRKPSERPMKRMTPTSPSSSWISAMLPSLKRVETLPLAAWLTRSRCKLLQLPRVGRALFVVVVTCVPVSMVNLQSQPLISLPKMGLYVPSRLRSRQLKRQRAHHWRSRLHHCHLHRAPHRPCSPQPRLLSRPSMVLLRPPQLVYSHVQPRELAKVITMRAQSDLVALSAVRRARPTSIPKCTSLASTVLSSRL